MNDPVSLIRSAVPGIVWPAIPDQEGAASLALQYQLEHTQWLAPAQLRELQFRQLEVLLRHAHETVPYYRERWRGLYDPTRPLAPEAFSRLPLLARSELQAHFDTLKSNRIPAAHGPVAESRTSGSTGMPVRMLKTALIEFWWRVLTVRDHRWHRRNLSGKLAAIRHRAVEAETEGWGPATDTVFAAGRSATLPISTGIDAQLDWLARQRPDYLLSYPSNVAELARRSLARGARLPGLREVRTMGEALGPEVRGLCRQAWDVPVTDVYSSDEAGYIALQCPDHEHYHVQSEGLLVEVLDEDSQPSSPGRIGRLVVTTLHNFAMPLVRYEIGDFAEAGEPCRCGRGLPVLTKILGRSRNMLVLADGTRYWPAFGSAGLAELAPILQQQLVQKDFHTLEARLVTARPLAPAEEERLRRHIQARLPASFAIRFSYCDAIGRSNGGKFEDFVCELTIPR